MAAWGCEPVLTVPGAVPGGTLIEGLAYSSNDEGVELVGDLYLPRPAIIRPPVVVLVHGGGFFHGDRGDGVGLPPDG